MSARRYRLVRTRHGMTLLWPVLDDGSYGAAGGALLMPGGYRVRVGRRRWADVTIGEGSPVELERDADGTLMLYREEVDTPS